MNPQAQNIPAHSTPAQNTAVQAVATERALGSLRRVHRAPGFLMVLARAVAAIGLSVIAVFAVRLIDVVALQPLFIVVVGMGLAYLFTAPFRSGEAAFVYDDGLVYARRGGAVGMRWDEMERLEVIDRWTPEGVLRRPNYVLTRRDGVMVRVSGFVGGSKTLGVDLLQRLPASTPGRRGARVLVFVLFAAVLTALSVLVLAGLVHLIDLRIDG